MVAALQERIMHLEGKLHDAAATDPVTRQKEQLRQQRKLHELAQRRHKLELEHKQAELDALEEQKDKQLRVSMSNAGLHLTKLV